MNEQQKAWVKHFVRLDRVDIPSLEGLVGSEAEAHLAYEFFETEASLSLRGGGVARMHPLVRSRLQAYFNRGNGG